MSNRLAVTLLVLGATLGSGQAYTLPAASFARLPAVESPTLSPDGEFIATVLNAGDIPVVAVTSLASHDLTTILKLENADDRIEWLRWANDERLLISASFSAKLYGDRIRVNRLYAVDRDGSKLQELRRRTSHEQDDVEISFATDRILSILRDDPEHVLLEVYDERDRAPAVFKVNIYENKFDKQFVNSYEVDTWVADADGNVVLGIGWDEEVRTLWHRPPGSDKWEKLHERELFVGETFEPVAISGDKAMVLSDYELGRTALWQYDIKRGEFDEVLFAANAHDLDDVLWDNDQRRIVGASWFEHFKRRHYFDQSDSNLSQAVHNAFPQFETFIASRSRDGTRVIAAAVRDDTPLKYFWLDMNSRKAGAWFSQYPELEGVALAKVRPFEFDARDGMHLNGYLTLPVQTANKPPLIVFPHGGPWARDYQYFDPYVQFFADLGYAVLQVNFRGSEGFGSEYLAAGYRQWGRAMQGDVYDAIDWLAGQELVDTSRACVVGASYGGYVALTAAVQQPDRFACIVSIAGVGDLIDLVQDSAKYKTAFHIWKTMTGDPDDAEQRKAMADNSPVRHVERIKSPILLIHGTHDTRVPVVQSQEFARKAEGAGVDVEYLELAAGTHYLDYNANRLQAFEAIDRFLGKHLPREH